MYLLGICYMITLSRRNIVLLTNDIHSDSLDLGGNTIYNYRDRVAGSSQYMIVGYMVEFA
jgi:hypothetical protein